MRDVLISVPTRGQVQWQTITALELQRDRLGGSDQPAILYQEASLSVALARNMIVHAFRRSDCDVLAMVDDDVAPPANFVELMLPSLDGYGMLAWPHISPLPKDQGKMHLTAYNERHADGEYTAVGLFGGLNDVDAVATGCVLIPREVFEHPEIGWEPFEIDADPRARIRSDDLLFCRKLRRAGFKVGVYWDGHPADHFRHVTLTEIGREQLHYEGMAQPGSQLLVVGETR